MRRFLSVSCIAMAVAACHATPKSADGANAAAQPSQASGKIPITTSSSEALALYLKARALNETLHPHEAHALFVKAVAIDPSFAMAEYNIASTAPNGKEVSEHLQKALALAPRVSPGERLFIQSLEARTHADRPLILQLAESLVAKYPRDERAHLALASVYSAQQTHDRGVDEFRKAIELNPEYSLAYNQLGYSYRSLGNLDSAEASFRRYIAVLPNDPNPYDSYAELLMKMGRFDESIVQYRKALAIDPAFGGSHVGIAADQMLSGHRDAAIAELEEYLAAARDDSERRAALYTLAMIYVDAGATMQALHTMDRRYAIAKTGGDTAGMSADGVAMGDILLEAGRIPAARDRYREARDLVKTSGLPAAVQEDNELARHYDLARVALAESKLALARTEAAAYMSGATSRHNDARVRQAHELNGLVALETHNYSESLRELAQADQENPAVWYAMSKAYAGKGDMVKAEELSKQVLHANIIPTLPYVFTRAAIAAATRLATSGSAPGTQH